MSPQSTFCHLCAALLLLPFFGHSAGEPTNAKEAAAQKAKKAAEDAVINGKARVMEARGIATDDLYTAILPKLAELQNPKDVHFKSGGYLLLGAQVAKSIAGQLPGQSGFAFKDPKPQRYKLSARASKLDPRTKEYPEIGFVFGTDKKPEDLENAIVDTSVAPRGKLVIWMMGHNALLFDRLADYGLHAVQIAYANQWFGKICLEKPVDENCRGNVRIEAATGEDFSKDVDIQKPDGMMERARQFVAWLAQENPQGGWDYFLTADGKDLRWEDVIMAGSSHGSTTSARFAKYKKVSRVVMFCGPRDQYQVWQKLPSATPENRYFGFSHVLDGGWAGDHYCRSWELIGLNKFGPIVNVDQSKPPFENSRRLITDFDVKGDAGRAHSSVQPGGSAWKDGQGNFKHEAVWRYLFTHPVDQVGKATPLDPDCDKEQRQ